MLRYAAAQVIEDMRFTPIEEKAQRDGFLAEGFVFEHLGGHRMAESMQRAICFRSCRKCARLCPGR